MRTLNFKTNRIELLSIDELEQTYRENMPDGTPVGGIYHFEFLRQLMHVFSQHGLHLEADEVFAAQNRERLRPGVTVLRNIEERDGEGALTAHLLRRVYANLRVADAETDETVTNLAVAYHQRGIQIGIGPLVKVCHNQTILGAEYTAATYGPLRASGGGTPNALLTVAEQWAEQFDDHYKAWQMVADRLREKVFSRCDMLMLVGRLTELRIRHDTADATLRSGADYPLNSSQINFATEKILVDLGMWNDGQMSNYWDAYQCLNYSLRPEMTDIPQVLPQQVALIRLLNELSTQRP